jgi:hypothetical protein
MADSPFHIIVDSSPASDSWGFVGRVMIAEHECFRTLRAFSTPGEAQSAAQVLVSDVLGEMLAAREWRLLSDERGHAATREDLGIGLSSKARQPVEGQDTQA